VHLGLLLRELAARHQLADQRVVLRQADQVPVAQHVGARVADMRDRDLVLADVRSRDRRPHPGGPGIGAGAVVNRPVRVLDDLDEPVRGRSLGHPRAE
jgi:hypothetical protein